MKMFYEIEVYAGSVIEFKYNGGSTVNVYSGNEEVDVFTNFEINEKGYNYFISLCENYIDELTREEII